MLGWLVVACTSSPPPDLVLVTLDTTRADRLGAYGYREATPALDALAADGRRFEWAFSAIPLTVPSHSTLFTGRYPPHTGVRGNDQALPASADTLAERLGAAGYATAAFVGATVTTRTFGFAQGFATYDDELHGAEERPAAEVVDRALAWERSTRDQDAPRFVWVHLYDPHQPNVASAAHPDAYDAALADCDAAVGRLRAAFDRRATVFTVVGDHGESLGEHGEATHSLFVYPSTQRVPWLLVGPGVPPGDVAADPVSVVDVAPTLLAALDLPPLADADGRAVPGEPRPLYLESWQLAQRLGVAPHVGVVDGGDLLIGAPRPELYDLAADPGATADRAAADPDRVKALQAALAGFGFGPPDAGPQTIDPAELQKLAALGYVSGGAVPAGDLPDPKDRRDLIADVQAVEQAVFGGRAAEAEPVATAAAARWPEVAELHGWRAWALGELGRDDEAVIELRKAVAANPNDVTLQLGLAAKLVQRREFDEATNLYVAAALGGAAVPRVRERAVGTLLDTGHPELAEKLAAALLDRDPDALALQGLLGLSLVRQDRAADAQALLEVGASVPTPEPGVLLALATLVAPKDRGRAGELLDRELAIRPVSPLALLARCGFHHADRHPAAMHALARKALALAPDDPAALTCEAAAALDDGDLEAARRLVDRALALAPQLPEAVGLDRTLRAGSPAAP